MVPADCVLGEVDGAWKQATAELAYERSGPERFLETFDVLVALIRALGGTRRLIAGYLAAEFAALGLFAGIVAVVGAETTVLILQTQVFELGASLHPWLWLVGPLVGALLIMTVGILGTRRLVSAPPITVLRGLN